MSVTGGPAERASVAKHAKQVVGKPFQIRLPGLTAERSVGLGDVVSHITTGIGIRPCSACARRAARLNEFMQFTGRR